MVSAAASTTKRTRARGESLKWLYLVLGITGPAVIYFRGVTPGSLALSLAGIGASAIVGYVWFLAAWSSIPAEDRHVTQLGRYSLFWVAMRFFIPVYGTFWLFASLSLLCKAINESLAKRQMPMRTSALLGASAPVVIVGVQLVAPRDAAGVVLSWSVASVLWFVFMLVTDHARRFMILACLAEREKNEAAKAALRSASKPSGAPSRSV